MSTDGFSTLSAGLMERGTSRVRAVLGNGAAVQQPIDAPQPQHQATVSASPQRGSARATFGLAKRPEAPSNADTAPIEAPMPAETPKLTELSNSTEMPRPTVNGEEADAPIQSVKPAVNGNTADAPKKIASPAPKETPAVPEPKLEQTSRRGNSGSTLMISQPPSGDMSEVTISLWGAKPEDTSTPSKNGQRPTSVTYERCTLDEHDLRDGDQAEGEEKRQLWIDTPSFSGPDRRHMQVSPEVERRKTVPPRLKVGVRLEQERYLRLKLATQHTDRTQQDIITSALDTYLDEIGVDRFVRIAMGFGGATPSVGPHTNAAEQVTTEEA